MLQLPSSKFSTIDLVPSDPFPVTHLLYSHIQSCLPCWSYFRILQSRYFFFLFSARLTAVCTFLITCYPSHQHTRFSSSSLHTSTIPHIRVSSSSLHHAQHSPPALSSAESAKRPKASNVRSTSSTYVHDGTCRTREAESANGDLWRGLPKERLVQVRGNMRGA